MDKSGGSGHRRGARRQAADSTCTSCSSASSCTRSSGPTCEGGELPGVGPKNDSEGGYWSLPEAAERRRYHSGRRLRRLRRRCLAQGHPLRGGQSGLYAARVILEGARGRRLIGGTTTWWRSSYILAELAKDAEHAARLQARLRARRRLNGLLTLTRGAFPGRPISPRAGCGPAARPR